MGIKESWLRRERNQAGTRGRGAHRGGSHVDLVHRQCRSPSTGAPRGSVAGSGGRAPAVPALPLPLPLPDPEAIAARVPVARPPLAAEARMKH